MSKTQIIVLWGLALAIVVVFVIVGQVLTRRTEVGDVGKPMVVPEPQYNLADHDQSARHLYPRAKQAAQSWQGDAELVSAVANWPYVQVDDLSAPAAWTFQFYSADTHRIYVVSVDQESVVVLKDSLSPYALSAVPERDWALDSHGALNGWLNNGGATLLSRHAVVDVSARLRPADDGRLEWIVAGVTRDGQASHITRIDAGDGTVLD